MQTRDSLIFSVKRGDSEHKAIIVSQSMITSMTLMNKIVWIPKEPVSITYCRSSTQPQKISSVSIVSEEKK